MEANMTALFLVGRIILGGYFLYNGINHFLSMGFMAQYAGSKGVPAPEVAVLGSGLLLLIAGAGILLGMFPKIAIACAAIFLLGVSPMMHNFWAVPAEQQMAEMVNFTKNMALLGATLMLVAIPEPWAASVGARRRVPAL
jgi:putative oxidoreductase